MQRMGFMRTGSLTLAAASEKMNAFIKRRNLKREVDESAENILLKIW
jgi:hypothetical protein